MTTLLRPLLNFYAEKEKDGYNFLNNSSWFNRVDILHNGKFVERVHVKEIPFFKIKNFIEKENNINSFKKKL
tara:strand:+ start:446 stop:661 length:216 start_codon:yes stop_codon:yes gene_type:complete